VETSVFGVIFAIHYQWYRNIKILIIAHAIMDFLSIWVFKLAQVLPYAAPLLSFNEQRFS